MSSIIGSSFETSGSSSDAHRWQAPEMATTTKEDIKDREVLEKADVWSFAITALEVKMGSNRFDCLMPFI